MANLDYYAILFSQFMFLLQTMMCSLSNLSTDFKKSFCLNFGDRGKGVERNRQEQMPTTNKILKGEAAGVSRIS